MTILLKDCHSQCRGRLTQTFHLAENGSLRNHVFHWETVPSPVECGRQCFMNSKCTSFNYDLGTFVCELNSDTRKGRPADFVETPGSTYYDSGEISDLPTPSTPDANKVNTTVSEPGNDAETSSAPTFVDYNWTVPADVALNVSAPTAETPTYLPLDTIEATVPVDTMATYHNFCHMLAALSQGNSESYILFTSGSYQVIQIYCDDDNSDAWRNLDCLYETNGWACYQQP